MLAAPRKSLTPSRPVLHQIPAPPIRLFPHSNSKSPSAPQPISAPLGACVTEYRGRGHSVALAPVTPSPCRRVPGKWLLADVTVAKAHWLARAQEPANGERQR